MLEDCDVRILGAVDAEAVLGFGPIDLLESAAAA